MSALVKCPLGQVALYLENPAKFRENILMRFRVTVRKLKVTERQTDGRSDGQTDGRTDGRGHCNISRPGPSAPREIIIKMIKS